MVLLVFLCVEMCAEFRWEVQAGHAVERGTAYNRKDQTHQNCDIFMGKIATTFWPYQGKQPELLPSGRDWFATF
jgi:hypothetical protein